MIDPDEITRRTSLETFRNAFNRRVGVGPKKMNYADLSDQSGILVRTLKSWHDGDAMPQLDSFLRLCLVFGPDFTSEVMGIIGQGGVERIDGSGALNAMGVCADLVQMTNEITERLRDEVFDRKDKAEAWPMLIKISRMIEETGKVWVKESSH